MQTAAPVPAPTVVACLAAGAYGMLRNQISFTVGPAHFHDPKFDEHRLPQHLHDRRGAAIVGWRASWWMGLLLSPPLVVASLFALGPGVMALSFLKGTSAAAIVTLAVAVGALGLMVMLWSDASRLDSAATMRGASDFGGGVGASVGLAATFRSVPRGHRGAWFMDTQRAQG